MKNYKIPALLLAVFTIASCSSEKNEDHIATADEIDQYLHVPSPRWEDQIIYFILTDRFMDGDTSNNDQGAGEYKKGAEAYWNGGDLKGITKKIDYIKELGATGIWITPPVSNQWVNPQRAGTGNHGYWARNFIEVDKHYGTLEDYKQLSANLHKNGMYLIQDVVCNHMGDFFTYTGPYDPTDVTQNFKLHDVPQPDQYPFDQNNALDPEQREMAIYHFTPNFQDHTDTFKRRNYQFADLDDLNTSNPIVRETLRKSYNHWIGEAGVDGFRFDTPMMVEHDFWNDFIHSGDTMAPGVEKFARSIGKEQFLTFGEAMVRTMPYDHSATWEAARFLGTEDKPEMVSVLNFPLVNTIGRVFQEMKPTDLMTFRLNSIEKVFEHPEWLLNFIDNHDGARFLTCADRSSFRQALLFIMTIPGIPVIYYGTEQEFMGTRQTMFRGGVGSPDRDHFVRDNESFEFMQRLMHLRKNHSVFRRGKLEVLRDVPGGPGIFVYSMKTADTTALVLFNTSESRKLADNINTGLEPGSLLASAYSLTGNDETYTVDPEGNISVILAPKEGMILLAEGIAKAPPDRAGALSIDPLEETLIDEERITLAGTSDGLETVKILLDGDYERTITAEIETSGKWTAEIPLRHLPNGKHRITAFSMPGKATDRIISDHRNFELKLPAVLAAEYSDESADDHGPEGDYLYPAHPSFNKQMDIEAVKVYTAGTNLMVEITMAEITRIWNPPSGFDHVLINIYIDLPGREGVRVLPNQNAVFPGEGAWDYMSSTAGFVNTLFSSKGASKTHSGRGTGPTPFIRADKESRTISFMFASEALGYPSELTGSKIYVTTWEGGPGNLRDLNPEAGPWTFGGGTGQDPRIMDDTDVLILK